MENLRKRAPFVRDDGDGNPEDDDAHIMDEEEQEETIESIRSASKDSDQIHRTALIAVLAVSIVLQLSFITTAIIERRHWPLIPTPLSAFFPSDVPGPLVPGALFWSILATTLLAQDFLTLLRSDATVLDAPIPMVGHYLSPRWNSRSNLYAIAPTICILWRKDFPQLLWWLLPPMTIGLVGLAQNMMRATSKDLEDLDKLRYRAKGA